MSARFRKVVSGAVAGVATAAMLSGCAGANQVVEGFARSMQGSSATIRTYDKQGAVMDEVSGRSIQVTRDERFDIVEGDKR